MKCALVLAVAAALLLVTVNARPNFNVTEETLIQDQALIDFGKCAKCVLGSCLTCKGPCVDDKSIWKCASCIGNNCIDCIKACK